MKQIFKNVLKLKLEQLKTDKVVKVKLDDIVLLDYNIGSELFKKIEKVIDEYSDEYTDFEIIENFEDGHTVFFILFKK
jgi:hypothetical protein